jgi:ceramide glucosyltransferase
VIYVICAVAFAYQALALVVVLVWRLKRRPARAEFTPSVSILKPVRGAAPGFYEAIRSNAAQDYPNYEVLFGASRPHDPALPLIDRLAHEFSHVRFIPTTTEAPNGKAGTLIDLAREARGDVWIVSDADIRVPEGYVSRVVSPLADPTVGLVTCVYRARSSTFAGRFEALGVDTDFAPSTMLAPFAGVDEFALGSTMAFRAADLARAGGFEAVAAYLADDYQIGRNIHALGLRCVLSEVPVETHIGGESWAAVWRHQLRWARTIRVSRFGGYLGLPVTFATAWAVLAAAAGHPLAALALLAARLAMAAAAAWAIRSSTSLRLLWLVPLRDLYSGAVWLAGLFGSTVEWGGAKLRLDREGRIRR